LFVDRTSTREERDADERREDEDDLLRVVHEERPRNARAARDRPSVASARVTDA